MLRGWMQISGVQTRADKRDGGMEGWRVARGPAMSDQGRLSLCVTVACAAEVVVGRVSAWVVVVRAGELLRV